MQKAYEGVGEYIKNKYGKNKNVFLKVEHVLFPIFGEGVNFDSNTEADKDK